MSGPILGYVQAAAQYGLNSILVKPKRGFGPFIAQVTVRETHTDRIVITEHPVEQGAPIADHAYKMPAGLVIECAWSNSPSVPDLFKGIAAGLEATVTGVQSLIQGNSEQQVRETYDRLLTLQVSRIPFDVFTGKRFYKDMLMASLVTSTDKETENSLIVTAEFEQVIIVRTQTVTLTAAAANLASPQTALPPVDGGVKQLTPSTRLKEDAN